MKLNTSTDLLIPNKKCYVVTFSMIAILIDYRTADVEFACHKSLLKLKEESELSEQLGEIETHNIVSKP